MSYKTIDFDVIDSTNLYLKQNYQNEDNFTFVSALFQNKGKGRNVRKWQSTSGDNLLFSLLIKDKNILKNYQCLSMLTATAIFKVLKSLSIENVSIKWPNDVYVNDKKICGILLEGISYDNELKAIVIGVGLNVNENSFNKYELYDATSIRIELNKKNNINRLKVKVYDCLINEINKLENNDYSYLDIARKNNYLLNKEVYAQINNKKELVKVLDINEDNSLKILVNGKIENLFSGEITFHKE